MTSISLYSYWLIFLSHHLDLWDLLRRSSKEVFHHALAVTPPNSGPAMRFAVPCSLYLLFLLRLSFSHPGSAHRNVRVRPLPSEHLPLPDLKEDPNPEYDPREQDLSESALRKKLGSSFDAEFMSVTSPNATVASGLATSPPPAAPGGTMPDELRRLDMTRTPYGLHVRVGKKARRKFLQFLWSHTHCPVLYTWRDLGLRFWPRYVREGHCFTRRSCSLPQGMFCKPSASVSKTFLRWYCQGFLPQKFCTWIPVHYPIISQCKCACWGRGSSGPFLGGEDS